MVETVYRNVLLATNDSATARAVLEALARHGARGSVVADTRAAAQKIQDQRWDLLLADLHLGEADTFVFLRQVRHEWPEAPFVLIAEQPPVPLVVRAMREGCHDLLTKPLDRQELAALFDSLMPNHAVPLAATDQEDSRCLYQIAGQNPQFLQTIRLAVKAARTSVSVLITGESGTGKELLSFLLHRNSGRRGGPYIRVNCASLSESLLESELFGHERGAFTGAIARRKGRFERAHGGTLLLDEISETTPRLQAELLRVLEQQDFERVGGSESVRVNVRIISTSNRDLRAEVEQGRFRKDLYYRISGIHLTVPPLRERSEDLGAFIWHFVNLYAPEVRRQITSLDAGMLELFQQYPWPGNIRQLRNVVRAALILGEGPVLTLRGVAALEAELLGAAEASGRPADADTLSLDSLERVAVLEALRRTQRNQAKAARLLGITDRTLREKLRRYRQDGLMEPAGELRS